MTGLALSAINGQATFTGPVGPITPASSVNPVVPVSSAPVSASETPDVAVDLTPLVWTLSPAVVSLY